MNKHPDGFEFRINVIPITAIFVALKIFGAIDWDWLWVLSPLWLFYLAVCIFAAIVGINHCLEDKK